LRPGISKSSNPDPLPPFEYRVKSLPLLVACAGLIPGCGSSGPRRFDAEERAELATALRTFTFPMRQADFWNRLPFPRRDFKPWYRSLTTGTIWDRYFLDDDRFLVLRTLCDGRPDVEDWIDGASIAEIPGHPWAREP